MDKQQAIFRSGNVEIRPVGDQFHIYVDGKYREFFNTFNAAKYAGTMRFKASPKWVKING